MFDVVIVGAGPAGTAAAFDLLEKGMTVLLLDKYKFPRKKACAGGITPKGYHLYKYDISSMVKRKCSALKINPPEKKTFTITAPKTLCYMTNRTELDFFSLNKVLEKGAQFKIVNHIFSIEESSFGVDIKTSQGDFKAAYLIGADGANSRVRQLITKTKFYKKLFALEADVQVDSPSKYPMEFDFSKSAKGYFWIFPKDNHLNVGIYSTHLNDKPKLRELIRFVRDRVGDVSLEAIKGYPICVGGAKYQPGSKRILLAGDAAGLAESLFGEGIYFALKSGQLAARAISRAYKQSGSANYEYRSCLKNIQSDLRIYDYSAALLYKFPWLSFKVASIPAVKHRFAKAYSDGNTLLSTVFPRS